MSFSGDRSIYVAMSRPSSADEPSAPIATYRLRKATLSDADTLMGFQIAMAKETEGIDLCPATVSKGIRIPFAHPSLATFYVAELIDSGCRGCLQPQSQPLAAVSSSPGSSSPSSPPSPLSSSSPSANIVSGLMITNEYNVCEDATMWWIQSVYTVPEHRRRGLFAALYAFVKGRIDEAEKDASDANNEPRDTSSDAAAVVGAADDGADSDTDRDRDRDKEGTRGSQNAHMYAGSSRVLGLRLYVEHENEAAQRSYAALGMRVDPYVMAKEMKGSI